LCCVTVMMPMMCERQGWTILVLEAVNSFKLLTMYALTTSDSMLSSTRLLTFPQTRI